MDSNQRNSEILKKIVEYCDRIDATKARYGNSLETLENDYDYTSSTAMSILQIGELTTRLTTGFKKKYGGVPWQDIKAMRNIAAHHYGQFRLHYLWSTMNVDIAPLRDYCNQCINELSKLVPDNHTDKSMGESAATVDQNEDKQ
jgi:uncharacterized protein with HEPN domain